MWHTKRKQKQKTIINFKPKSRRVYCRIALTTTTRASCFDSSFSRNFGFVSVFSSKIMHLILFLVLKSLANSQNASTICIFVVSLSFSFSHTQKRNEKNKKNLKHKISQIKQNLSQYANLMQMLCIFKSLVNFLNIYLL